MASPAGLIRLAGILFPGNCSPVNGSVMGTCAPVVVTVWEKSPARSSAVGIVKVLSMTLLLRSRSYEKKKNSFVRLLLKLVPGMISGPPMVPPGFWYRYFGLATFSLLLNHSLALNISCRQ